MLYVYKENLIMISYVLLNFHIVYDFHIIVLKTNGKLEVVWLVNCVFSLILLEDKQRLNVGEFDQSSKVVF